MNIQPITYIISIILSGVFVFIITSVYYQNKLKKTDEENIILKSKQSSNDALLNLAKIEFSKIAQESLKYQQEQMLDRQTNDYNNKMQLFVEKELIPINKLLMEFKNSIDNYQKEHTNSTQEIKNAIAIAEQYARALTTNQNIKGIFGEELLEQLLQYANLKNNIHYKKQLNTEKGKPDFILLLPNNNNIIIDCKVILQSFIDYQQEKIKNNQSKKKCIKDLTNCINDLADRNYEEIKGYTQPGFILMYIPIESYISLIYTDIEFKKIVELASSKNIIIVGTSSMLVTLKLINQLWANKYQNDNIKNIIETARNIYTNISTHYNSLLNIQTMIDKAQTTIKTEMNRFTNNYNGSIIKEVEKLKEYGINIGKDK